MEYLRSEVVPRLRRALTAEAVVTDPDQLEACRTDRSGHRSDAVPLAVVFARSIEDVQVLCRIATETGTPVVTRGAGTGLAGGAVAGAGEIVLSTEHMNRVLEISVANRLTVVEPGILNGELNRILAEHGLWWAPDPASKEISTVGGNIAMNAGGLLCTKYGVTREAVLALKVVLADGRLISVGHRTVKGVTGYDLCALMVGSEGTLGVIVEATLALRPVPEGTTVTLGAFFDDVHAGAAAASAVIQEGATPAIMELVDAQTVAHISRYLGVDAGPQGAAFLLIQADGPQAREEAERIADVVGKNALSLEVTEDPERSRRLVDLRRAAFPALETQGTLLVEDIAVPRDRLSDAYTRIAQIQRRHGVQIATTCHAGDGNLHPTFVVEGPEVPQFVWDAAGEVFTAALELGGTLTGEHGVGLLKRAWLGEELGGQQLELQRQIKAVFDPDNLLNPGKVF